MADCVSSRHNRYRELNIIAPQHLTFAPFAPSCGQIQFPFRINLPASASICVNLRLTSTFPFVRRAPKVTVTRKVDSLCQKGCYPMANTRPKLRQERHVYSKKVRHPPSAP